MPNDDQAKKDDLIVIGGAGGFIAGALARYFKDKGFTAHLSHRQKTAPRVVSAGAWGRKLVPGPQRQGQLRAGL